MRILVKIGGAQLQAPAARRKLCGAIAHARQQGNEILVVHGGGNQIRRVGARLGLVDHYHEGLRITDADTAEVALMVLGGLVNRTLVHTLQTCGVPAVGLTGADGATFSALRQRRDGVDLGFVGAVDDIDARLVQTLLQSGHTPVLGTVAPGTHAADGEPFLNINADHAAGPLCRAFACDALLFLTDVPAVLDGDGRPLPLLTAADCARLVAAGVATGGMQPKLEAALLAARENPRAIVKIAAADADDCVLAALKDGVGSRFFGSRNPEAVQHG
ncbi:MAG TPA: acetylglutamate kinase [bacterium]|nr:acetylglutamate kinase [bacterium]